MPSYNFSKAACILQAAFVLLVITGCGFNKPIEIGDFVSLSYTEETEQGKVISRSADFDSRPALLFRERSLFRDDFFAQLGLLSKGDKAIFKINRDSLVHFSGREKFSAVKGKYILYRVTIHDVVARGDLSDSLFNSRIEAFRAAEIEKARVLEEAKLRDFVAAHAVDGSCASGLKYKILNEGSGEKALPGDTIEVHYTATYLSGKPFETTNKVVAQEAEIYNPLLPYQPFKLTISTAAPLSGFEEGMLLFPKGTDALLVIPSALAYGAQGKRSILPYTPIACTIKIVDIKFQRKR